MKTTLPTNGSFEFCFPERDTLVRVEETEGSVIIRATRDSFSATRKASFIRELAAEGFIGDCYRWFSVAEPDAFMGVQWLVDISWLTLPETALAQARYFMSRMIFGGCLVWLGLMLALFQGWLGGLNTAPSGLLSHLTVIARAVPSRVAPGHGEVHWLK